MAFTSALSPYLRKSVFLCLSLCICLSLPLSLSPSPLPAANNSLSFHSEWDCVSNSSLPVGIWSGLGLYGFWECCHHYCNFTGGADLRVQKSLFPSSHSPPLALTLFTLFSLFCKEPRALGRRAGRRHYMCCLDSQILCSPLFSALWPDVSPRANHHLLQIEVSQMRIKRCIDEWVEQ